MSPPAGSVGGAGHGTVTLEFARGEVIFDGKLVELSPTEDELLVALVRHRGRVLTVRELCELSGVDTNVRHPGNELSLRGDPVSPNTATRKPPQGHRGLPCHLL
jgi:hypothetical protein